MYSHPGGYLSTLHYQEPLREHIQELLEEGVIKGLLQHKEEGTWVSNLVTTGKK